MSAYRMSRARRAAIVACVSVVAATGVVGLRPFDAPVPRALADVGAEASGAANSGVVNPGSVKQESADAADLADAAGGTGDSSGGVNTTVPGTSGVDSTRFEDVRDAVVARSEPVDLSALSYADAYRTLWLRIEDGTDLLERLRGELSDATAALELARVELTTAARHQDRADVESVRSGHDLDDAARDLYMTGSTGVDAAFQALSGSPEDVLASIDSVRYVTSAGDSETLDFERAAAEAARMQDATAVARAWVEATRAAVESVQESLTTVREQVAADRESLNALIATASAGTEVGPDGCATSVPAGTVPDSVDIQYLCRTAVNDAATPQAQLAVQWALIHLGAPYACEGVGRLNDWVFDCSSYVSRAYGEGAGLDTAGADWAPTTRNMLPWGGASLDAHYEVIDPQDLAPGDLVLYDTCTAEEKDEGECDYRHVVMYLGEQAPGMGPLMAHTNACGEVSRVVPFTGTDVSNFLGARRVVASKKELKAAGLWEKTDGDDTGGDDAKAAGTAGAVEIAPGKPEDTVA
ncbi:MAG: hypothetical protein VW780_08625 [Actinomycetota bacterium]